MEQVTKSTTEKPVVVEKKTHPFVDVLREKARTHQDQNVATVLNAVADAIEDYDDSKQEPVRAEYETTREGFAVDPSRPNSTSVLRDTPRVSGVQTVPVPVAGTAIVSEPVAVQETGPATFVEK